MSDFRKKGYTYESIKHTKGTEYIKWKTGFRNLWERITKKEYEAARDLT